MFRKVLFPTDGSEHSIKAAKYLAQLKQLYPQLEITQLFVQPEDPVLYNLGEYIVIDNEDRSADILRPTNNVFHAAGMEVDTLILKGQPAQKILETENEYDLVVMGARGMMQEGRGYLKDLRVWLGSISRRVLHRNQKPVTIVKDQEPSPLKKYLLATDGSNCSLKAADYLIDMIRQQPDAEVTLLHVNYSVPIYSDGFLAMPLDKLPEYTLEEVEKTIGSTRNKLEQAGIRYALKIRDGSPAVEITMEAKQGKYDLVVVGSHGYGAVDRMILGSVSERVAEEASCPVLVVK